jgi:membrane protein required for colicin V production
VGLARGFLREAIALVTWIFALVLAGHYADLIEPHLGGLLAGAMVKPWVARLIILALVLLIGALIGALADHFVRLSIFGGVDRLLGFVFGLLRGLVLLGVFVMLGQLLRLDSEHWWRDSRLMPYGESVANGLRFLVGEGAVPHNRDLRT